MIDKKQLVEANEVLAELASDGTEGYNILAKLRSWYQIRNGKP